MKKLRYLYPKVTLSIKTIILIIALVVTFTVLVDILVCEVPANALTRTNMYRIQVRILRYNSESGNPPTDLTDLPPDNLDKSSKIIDGWGHPILYSYDGKRVTLLSLGKDGTIGGEDDDKDLVLCFDPNNSDLLETIEIRDN